MRANSSTSQSDDFYRSVDENRILDLLCIAGWGEQHRRAPQAARDAATNALERWVAAGLPFRESSPGSRAFDPAEVINFAKALGIKGEDDFWEHAYVATARSLIESLRTRMDSSGRFQVHLERRVNLAHYDTGARVRIHLPLPVEDGSTRDVRAVPDVDGDTRIEPGRMVATVQVPQSKIGSVAAEISFSCHPERSGASCHPERSGASCHPERSGASCHPERSGASCHPERSRGTAKIPDTDLYLRPQEGLIEITPRVTELARNLGSSNRDPIAIVRRIWDFMFERMTLGVVHYDALRERPLDSVIKSGLFDCRLGSALIVALCRSSGIPARMRSGYALYDVPYYHYWAEVWGEDRGWLPFDLICWDLSLRGRDTAWTDKFFAQIDARMPTETLPHTFTGFPSVQFPKAWHVLSRPIPSGAAFGLFSVKTGAFVYEDRLSFTVNA